MSILISIVVFILVFSLLVLIHEFGHFYMAKRAGIKVEEFGFGLPPRLWGKKKGETIYSINWIPFGGFVRMLGEDSRDPKMLKSKRSFVAQPMRARVLVIIAGVVMNFLLAWLLMTIGFIAGMEPLLGPNDVFPAIEEGRIVLEEGVKIKSVEMRNSGLRADDTIIEVDGNFVNDYSLMGSGQYLINRDGEFLNINLSEFEELGVEFYDYGAFPRVKIHDLAKHSAPYQAGLRADDVIIRVNGSEVFDVIGFENIVRGINTLEYEVYRDGVIEKFIVERETARQVILSKVLSGGSAKVAGLREGDVVLSINGKAMDDSLEVILYNKQHDGENLAYAIQRDGQRIFYEITPEDTRIGVLLSELINFDIDPGMSLYNTDVLSTVADIKDDKYPWYVAPYKAVGETWRLSKMTANMFVEFVTSLIKSGEVPESVAGPVGIAQMTHVFVQEGLIPLLRFIAILSLSLAVINILPFPALDGGRLLFIVIEAVAGKPVPQKWEAYVHMVGYLLILGLIVAVTYSDIVRLIT